MSLVWGLACIVGILIPASLGSQLGPHRQQSRLAGHSLPKVSPQVSSKFHASVEDVRSTEQASDEARSSEISQEVRKTGQSVLRLPQQDARNMYLPQGGRNLISASTF